MKKSTILVLLIVFLGSVLIVGIFGMQAVPFEEIVYVREIVPTAVYTSSGTQLQLRQNSDGDYYVSVPYEEGLTILIMTKVTPDNSTNREIKLSVVGESADNPVVEIGEKGEIKFLRRASVRLQYRSQDSPTGPVMNFRIYVLKPEKEA